MNRGRSPSQLHQKSTSEFTPSARKLIQSRSMEAASVNYKNPNKRKVIVNDDEDGDGKKARKRVLVSSKPHKNKMALNDDEDLGDDARNMRRFKVLLPNGMSVDLEVRETVQEMSFENFIRLVQQKYFQARKNCESLKKKRIINWNSRNLFLKDTIDADIWDVIKLTDYKPYKCHILRLHDGSSDVAKTFQNMWDLTPDIDLLRELPEEYTFEAALADLIDNSLQAVWSNKEHNRKIIRVNVTNDKISIFDNGPGMDDSDENSLVKWGKIGASLHRFSKPDAIGGKPPYLMPCFGMYGYGGPIASMHLGRRTRVSSKTRCVKKVYMLFLEREALLSSSNSSTTWKTTGGMRDPSMEENRASYGNFTKVEIFEPNVKDVDIAKVQCHLKDIYFPYIQTDDFSDNGRTITPIQFQVNGVNLTEIQGGKVAITNLHSCNGPEFVLQLHLSTVVQDRDGTKKIQEANARLRFVYFPFTEGKENIERILEKLRDDGWPTKEKFQNFSRVSIRRLGRLLPDARWNLLPLMDFGNRKGNKADLLKRCSLRVKCFIETDAGFKPTQAKDGLAQNSPFTVALKNLGNKLSNEDDVRVEIYQDGKAKKMLQLEKDYQEWMLQMHSQYDEEADSGEDQPIIIISPTNKKELGISSDVVRVHRALKRKEKLWKQGQKIKVLNGACAGCYKGHVFATIEYFLLEGFQGDVGGEARIICRPIDISEEKGSSLSVNGEDASLKIHSSLSLPISVIDTEKVEVVGKMEWDKQLHKRLQKTPAHFNLMGPNHHKRSNVDEVVGVENTEWGNPLSKRQQISSTSGCSRGPSHHNAPNVDKVVGVENTEWDNPLRMRQQISSTSGCSRGPSHHKAPNVDQVVGVENTEWDNPPRMRQQISSTSGCSRGPSHHKAPNDPSNHKGPNLDEELDELCKLGEKIYELEKQLNDCVELKGQTKQEMLKLQDKLQDYGLGNMDAFSTKEVMLTKLKSMKNTAASVFLHLSSQENQQNNFVKDIIGVVALLGSVRRPELSRMLGEYLGKEKMLGVVFKSFGSASSLEMYKENGEIDCMHALHAEAAALGKAISKRFLVMCFENIRPYTGYLRHNDPQRLLALPQPKLPSGRIPEGFMGYAVNMVDLDRSHLEMRTASGYGLRETVLFSLFKKLHVYNTRANMIAARACIVDGAISLDGGIIRDDGSLVLGYGNPTVFFPSLNMMDLSEEAKEVMKELEERKTDLRNVEERIRKATKSHKKHLKTFGEMKKRMDEFMDEIVGPQSGAASCEQVS